MEVDLPALEDTQPTRKLSLDGLHGRKIIVDPVVAVTEVGMLMFDVVRKRDLGYARGDRRLA
jgi:hypothetical protein